MSLYYTLSNSKIVRCDGGVLRQDELMKLWNFVNMLLGSMYSTWIFRGESDENLREQYGYDTNTPDILAQCIFMAGEKGRICWNEKKFIDPDVVSTDNFRKICKILNKSIKEGCSSGSTGRIQKMQNFHSRNREFCEAFDDTENLVMGYHELPYDNRRKINLYYLSIIHTINSYKYHNTSGFVSATTSFKVAEQFTNGATIYGWVPKMPMSMTMRSMVKTIEYVLSRNVAGIKELGFPCCESSVYPGQKEISLRYGILPHFIVGFKAGSRFYVNPALFNTMDKLQEIDSFRKLNIFKRHLISYGLDVDQSDFEDFCRRTNFKRYYSFDGEKYQLHDLQH